MELVLEIAMGTVAADLDTERFGCSIEQRQLSTSQAEHKSSNDSLFNNFSFFATDFFLCFHNLTFKTQLNIKKNIFL